MKPPTRVKVFGTWYRVLVVPRDEVSAFIGQASLGACDYEKKRILLAVDQSTAELADSYRHELNHAKFRESGINDLIDSHFDSEKSMRVAESMVRLLTAAEERDKKK